MSFRLDDLPKNSRLRKAAIAAYANQEHAKVVGDGPPRVSSPQPRPAAGRPTYQCHNCGKRTMSLAGAQRHADSEGHHRIELVL